MNKTRWTELEARERSEVNHNKPGQRRTERQWDKNDRRQCAYSGHRASTHDFVYFVGLSTLCATAALATAVNAGVGRSLSGDSRLFAEGGLIQPKIFTDVTCSCLNISKAGKKLCREFPGFQVHVDLQVAGGSTARATACTATAP